VQATKRRTVPGSIRFHAQYETDHEELVTPIDFAARAVTFEHADCHLLHVSGLTSDVEAAMLSGLGKSPETSLLMSVRIFTHMFSNMRLEGLPVQPLGAHFQPHQVSQRG
jgi:hypothetical protein